jgi:hypothetical protein
VRTTYEDGSTEEKLFGAAGSGNEGLVIKTRDRRNAVTTCTFDSADRVAHVIVASEYDTNIRDSTGGSTPITVRNQQLISNNTFLQGTD